MNLNCKLLIADLNNLLKILLIMIENIDFLGADLVALLWWCLAGRSDRNGDTLECVCHLSRQVREPVIQKKKVCILYSEPLVLLKRPISSPLELSLLQFFPDPFNLQYDCISMSQWTLLILNCYHSTEL